MVNTLQPLRGMVKADAGQIEQVILNLAINARDAMPRGGRLMIETGNVDGVAVAEAIHAEARPGNYVMLAVSDNGNGMPQEILDHILPQAKRIDRLAALPFKI